MQMQLLLQNIANPVVRPSCTTWVSELILEPKFSKQDALTNFAGTVFIKEGNILFNNGFKQAHAETFPESFGCDTKDDISAERADSGKNHCSDPVINVGRDWFTVMCLHTADDFTDEAGEKEVSETAQEHKWGSEK